jgi:hypothetical protein
MGADWPLTVEDGVLACLPGGSVLLRTGGDSYTVNGTAKTQFPALYEIDRIWASDASGRKKNMSGLILAGSALCD